MQAIADKEKGGFKIEPWDYRFYAEKVRKAKYDLDMNEVKPYMQLDKLREGMFWAAGQLYGFEFTKIDGVPVYSPEDMSVYEVTRAGKHVGLWYFDPYAREGKRSGAWMNAYRTQEDGSRARSPRSSPTTPTSSRRARRAGADLLGRRHDPVPRVRPRPPRPERRASTYPSVSGTNVARDYVEFPSQLNEHWLPTAQVLSRSPSTTRPASRSRRPWSTRSRRPTSSTRASTPPNIWPAP
jgi:peptidyl-dipeptidase Dcp